MCGAGVLQACLRGGGAEMPSANDGLIVEDGFGAGEPAVAGVVQLKKEHGVYIKYVDGVSTGEGMGDKKKIRFRNGALRHFNRTVGDGADHPGRAYAESIRNWDVNHGRQVEFKVALQNFYQQCVRVRSCTQPSLR